jgi:hypothetical protein
LPATETTSNFNVSWSGQDNSGSGIASYSVYVSDDGGASFEQWPSETNTTDTSATYSGQGGYIYEFYSVATDNVGNVQQIPGALATTFVAPATQLWFGQEPTNTTAGGQFVPPIMVDVENQFGNTLTTDGSTVTLSVESGPGSLNGTVTATAVNGVATFNNVSLLTGGQYTLLATDGSLTKMISASFSVSTSDTWTGGQSNLWSNPNNWSVGALPGTATNVTINGSSVIAGSAINIAGLSINGGSFQLAAGSGTSSVSSLTITNGGKLDLANNRLFIDYGASDPISTIASYIKSGYNNGVWNGPGIISTTAQTPTNGHFYGVGYADGADGIVPGLANGQIELKYALNGDATLQGLVNGTDFNILAANFNHNITGWDQGDFNYDGLVNAADFNELAANFNQGVTVSAASNLVFAEQPTSTTAGSAINPAIVVDVEDAKGNLVTSDNSTVILSLVGNSNGLSGIVAVQAVDGVATFSNVALTSGGTYMLQAADGTLTVADSRSFLISATDTWTGSQSNDWGDANNWSAGATPGSTTNVVINGGTVTATAPFTIANLTVSGGTLRLPSGLGISTVSNLTISGPGTIDLANNELIINYGSSDPISTIASYLKAGYNNGAWNGTGIFSSAAAVIPGYALGYADGADKVVSGLTSGQIEIKYTLLGDANLDGLVNGSDFNILAANFNQSITGWDQGDFNYDGLVNAADFNDLAANFNQGANLNAPGLVAGSGAMYTITGSAGAQTLDILSGTVTLTSDLSALLPHYSLQIENGASVVLASDQHIGALQLLGSGSLDVSNYTMFINYGSNSDPITTIAGYIKSGYNGGGWNGAGIISTAARTPTNGLDYGLGYADGKDGVVSGLSSGQIEIKYTLLGDANLDGLVNGSDFNILAANFNQSITGWDQGDFNYDGLVNAADFNDLAANFNQGASGASVASSAAVLDASSAPAVAATASTVTTSTIESTANTTATPAAAATAPKVTTSTTSAARNMTAAPAVISAPLTVATVTTRSTAAAPPASKSKPVGVSKAVIANGKSKGSVMTTYAASVVTVPTSGSMATPQNTNDKDAKFLAHG